MSEPGSRYFALVDELLALEARNIHQDLDDTDRGRWQSVTRELFGTPAEHAEKRRYFRVEAEHRATVLSPGRDEAARVISISGGGLFVETQVPADVGSDLEVSVTIPERHDVDLRFRTRVCWCAEVKGQSRSRRGVGVEFVNLSNAQRAAILSLLRDNIVRNLEVTLEKFKFFFELSPDPTLLVDHGGRVMQTSERARSLLGLEPGVPSSPTLLDIVAQGSRESLASALAEARRSSATVGCELAIPGERDGDRIVEALVAPMRSGGVDLGLLVAGRDITDRLKLERERRDLERRLFQADKLASLGRIAAGIAHDINSPLAWVIGSLSTLDELVAHMSDHTEGRQDDPRELLDECLQGLRRIRDIVSDLRAFSRVDARSDELVDVNEVLEASFRIVRNQVEQVAHVERDLGSLPSTLTAFGKLSQALLNLVTNAAHSFDVADVRQNRVLLRTWTEEDRIFVSVGDNGRGIPREIQDRVFEPFFTTEADGGGTGLGLAIARDAVLAIGGDLTLRSDVGEGTEFVISLPVRKPPVLRREGGAPAMPDRKPRLLLVDDERMILRSLSRQLRKRWDVVTAASGKEALARLDVGRFDAIVSDVMIPEMSGADIHRAIEERDAALARRIVFMTGGAFGDSERATVEGLPNPVIEKPFDLKDLENLLLDLILDDDE